MPAPRKMAASPLRADGQDVARARGRADAGAVARAHGGAGFGVGERAGEGAGEGAGAGAGAGARVRADGWLPIGELARRCGVAASALRYYEAQGLIAGGRSSGGQRQYPRHVLRRVGFIRAAQAVGLSLDEIRAALQGLPQGRTPTKADWERLARGWQPLIDDRIAALTRLRDRLASCIGCGCLSLKACALYNPQDGAARRGAGPRYLLGDRPPAESQAPESGGATVKRGQRAR